MRRSVETSEIFKQRLPALDKRIERLVDALRRRHFPDFAQVVVQESDELHAVCADTTPPVHYLTDSSEKIMNFVRAYNEMNGDTRLAYSFDAGANAFLFFESPNEQDILGLLRAYFPSITESIGRTDDIDNVSRQPFSGPTVFRAGGERRAGTRKQRQQILFAQAYRRYKGY